MSKPAHEIERLPLAPGTLLQKGVYRIGKLLGSGGFALTYLAYQGRWGFPVCIKEYFPVLCKRRADGIGSTKAAFTSTMMGGLQAFRDEADALSRFHHPGIVRVLGSFQENRTTYIVQEFLDGFTLADGLEEAGKADLDVVLPIAQQIGQALIAVHAAGLVHSDLKPENLFRTRDGRYVLLDFGLTRGFLSSASARRGARGLSPGYCPPEQYASSRRLTPATDVYGFAATLYTLLSGRVPPEAPLRQKGAELADLIELNPSVSPKVEDALLRALELNVRNRTQEIREFLHHLGLDSTPKAVSYRPPGLRMVEERLAHAAGVNALSLQQGSAALFSCGKEGRVHRWSWPGLERSASYYGHTPIESLHASADGNVVVVGCSNGEVRLLPGSLQGEGVLLAGGGSAVVRVCFGGRRIAVARKDGSCQLFETSGGEVASWIPHAGGTLAMAFAPDGSYLATAGHDHCIRFWEIPQPRAFCELRSHRGPVFDIQFNQDGTLLISAAADKSLILWDLMTNSVLRELKGNQAQVLFTGFTDEGQVAALGSDRLLRIYQLASGQVAYQSDPLPDGVQAFATSWQQGLLATASSDGLLRLWSTQVEAKKVEEPPVSDGQRGRRLDPLVGLDLEGYTVEQRVDKGGRAAVYRAARRTQSVAVKIFLPKAVSPELLERLQKQQDEEPRLRHPNIVSSFHWGRLENLTYQFCELVEGWSLERYIPDDGLTYPEAREYLVDIVQALHHARLQGIQHGALRLEKVLVTARGKARVADFGSGDEPDGPALREMFFQILTGRGRVEWELLTNSQRIVRLSELSWGFPEWLEDNLNDIGEKRSLDYQDLLIGLHVEPDVIHELPILLPSYA